MLLLKVSDKNEICIGKVGARVGLMTKVGPITRVTNKSIWCQTRSGERMYRHCDGRFPWVTKTNASRHLMGGSAHEQN